MKTSLIDSGGNPTVITKLLTGRPENFTTEYNTQQEQAKSEWAKEKFVTKYDIQFKPKTKRTSNQLPQVIQQKNATQITRKQKFFRLRIETYHVIYEPYAQLFIGLCCILNRNVESITSVYTYMPKISTLMVI